LRVVSDLRKKRCTGCGACSNICPNGCIHMAADEEGFLYPTVDTIQCNVCGVCSAICPAADPELLSKGADPQVYAAWSLDTQTRYHSTSGGIFTELAKAVLRGGGLVAGARYDERHMVYHALIEREEDLALLRQSKYAQSDTNWIYQNVHTALNGGKQVLFVGTPCQCAAMRRFAGRTDRLILCDFICRGVNSPLVYAKYLEELEMRYGAIIQRVWFKNKKHGWNAFGTQVEFENGTVYFGGRDDDPFMFGYIKRGLNLYMRPSCGQCAFKGTARPTDMTLGDFWGIKLLESADDMKNGVSAVIVHTESGQRLFDEIGQSIFAEEHTIDEIIPGNACLTTSAQRDEERSRRFYQLLRTLPFSDTIEQIRMFQEESRCLN